MNIGRAIKQVRKERFPHLKQGEFAKRIGITQAYLSQIEGGHKTPKVEILERISTETAIPLAIMFWFGVEGSDVSETKREHFIFLKPSIDRLIKSIL